MSEGLRSADVVAELERLKTVLTHERPGFLGIGDLVDVDMDVYRSRTLATLSRELGDSGTRPSTYQAGKVLDQHIYRCITACIVTVWSNAPLVFRGLIDDGRFEHLVVFYYFRIVDIIADVLTKVCGDSSEFVRKLLSRLCRQKISWLRYYYSPLETLLKKRMAYFPRDHCPSIDQITSVIEEFAMYPTWLFKTTQVVKSSLPVILCSTLAATVIIILYQKLPSKPR